MKRFAQAALAALVIAGPITVSAAHADPRDRYDRRDYREDRRDDRRDDRRAERWNQRNHNGYYLGNRWYYGPPPAAYYNRNDFRPGYTQWRRGDRLPTYYRSHYREVDWRRERLREPPRGYHYVRDDRGQVLLVAIATGVILSLLLNN